MACNETFTTHEGNLYTKIAIFVYMQTCGLLQLNHNQPFYRADRLEPKK